MTCQCWAGLLVGIEVSRSHCCLCRAPACGEYHLFQLFMLLNSSVELFLLQTVAVLLTMLSPAAKASLVRKPSHQEMALRGCNRCCSAVCIHTINTWLHFLCFVLECSFVQHWSYRGTHIGGRDVGEGLLGMASHFPQTHNP